MSTVAEIQSALKDLPLEDAQSLATWLQKYLEGQAPLDRASAIPGPQRLPDYAARRREILGDKVLPNLVLMGRAEERIEFSGLSATADPCRSIGSMATSSAGPRCGRFGAQA